MPISIAWIRRKKPKPVNGDKLARDELHESMKRLRDGRDADDFMLRKEREEYKKAKHALDHRVALLEATLSLHDIPVPPR